MPERPDRHHDVLLALVQVEDGVIQLLVDHGADVSAEDNRCRTPLYLVEYGNANAPSESTAELLRALGAREPVVGQ